MVVVFKFFILISFLFTTSCGFLPDSKSSYSRSKIVEKVVDNCKKEYDIDLKAEVINNTLFISLELEDIILTARFLSEKSLEKINNVCLIASRAGLSACNDIHFYKIVASDSKNLGVQLVITQYVKDIKKFMIGLISRDDYMQRMEMKIQFNPAVMGKNIVLSFFKKMQSFSASQIISAFFPKNISINKISPLFFSMLMEYSMKTDKHYRIIKMKEKNISDNKCLVYVEVEESYKPLPKYADHHFLFPENHLGQYLFIINTKFLPKIIENIYSLQDFDKVKKNLVYTGFPQKYKMYENFRSWDNGNHFQTESISTFVVRQIINRVQRSFAKEEELKKLFIVTSIKGDYSRDVHTDEKILHFKIDINRDNNKDVLALNETYHLKILKTVLDIMVDLLYSFEFLDFDKIRIDYIANNQTLLVNSHLIKKFYKNKISINELVKMTEIIPSSF